MTAVAILAAWFAVSLACAAAWVLTVEAARLLQNLSGHLKVAAWRVRELAAWDDRAAQGT